VQLYVKTPNATVPVPIVRLADFERVPLNVNEEVTVTLTISPDFHSVVYDGSNIFDPQIMVEKGTLLIYVGGGQPDYYPGALQASVTILNTQDLSTC